MSETAVMDAGMGASGLPRNFSRENSEPNNDDLNLEIDQTQINVMDTFTQLDNSRYNNGHQSHKRRKTSSASTQKMGMMDTSPADAGIVLSLNLINFMCHSHFHLDFGHQTNFIIGHNGSGKSAVLTGISVCLGAKATDTDRGNSLKKLIMDGKNTARLTIVFKNEGDEAYEHETYGDTITIERVIKRENAGASQYKIKNHWGKVMSSKKSTIDEILEYYGITINNPMTILTQTEAKTFLAHSKDEDKFRYFMAGTRLDESIKNCNDIEGECKKVEERLIQSKIVVEETQARYNKAKEVWKNFRTIDETRRQEKLLHGKLIWLDIAGYESKATSAEVALRDRQEKMTLLEKTTADMKASIHELNATKNQIIDALSLNDQEIKQLETEQKEFQPHVLELSQKVKQIDGEMKSLTKENDKLRATLKDERKRYEKEEAKLHSIKGDAYEKLKTRKEQQENEIQLLEAKQPDLLQKKRDLRETFEKEVAALDAELKENKLELAQTERQIKESTRKEGSKFDSLPVNLQRLTKNLETERKFFKRPVVGPLALNISMKQEHIKWADTIEAILQKELGLFVVESFDDSKQLASKMSKFNYKGDRLVREPEIFDFRDSIPQVHGHKTLLDILTIEDKNVECILVDRAKIHSTLLVEDRREAESILLADHSRKIHQIFALNKRDAFRLTLNRSGGINSDPVHINRNNTQNIIRIQKVGDKETGLAGFKKHAEEISASIRDLESQREHLELKFAQDNKKNSEETKSVMVRIRQLQDIVFKLENRLSDDGSSGKLDALKEQISESELQISTNDEALQECEAEYQKGLQKLAAERDKLGELSKKIFSLQEKEKRSKRECNKIEDKIFDQTQRVQQNENRVVELNRDVEKVKNFLEMVPTLINDLKEQALRFCTREESEEIKDCNTVEEINERLTRLKGHLNEIENQLGITEDQARLDFWSQRNALEESREKLSKATKLHKDLKRSLKERVENLQSSRLNTCFAVNEAFQSALKLRGFKGELEFDFANKKLMLNVATKKHDELRKIESFSGGEKSFSQIAFLLAIWKPMHSKLRGLDEFDVFMDPVNRRMALKLILEKVAEHPKTQTIFITPLNIGEIEGIDNESVHIHEIADPRR